MNHLFRIIALTFVAGLPGTGCDEAEQVHFNNGETAFAGEICRPQTNGPHPAVVFIHGLSADEREVFRELAKLLAEQGIVSLLYDQRGAGKSSGDWSKADLQALAGDAIAAAKYLQQRPDIRKDNVGLAGFSQGGWIASLAASEAEEIAFVITLSTSAVFPAGQSDDQTATNPFGRDLEYEPLPGLRSLRAPLLMLFGEKDGSIPFEKSITLINTTMREAGRRDFAFRVVPNADHGLFTKPYHDSPLPLLQNLPLSPRFEPEALEAMVYWIKVAAPLHNSK